MLLWMDGIDQYGPNANKAEMLAGNWADISASVTIVSAAPTPRTGTYALQLADNVGSIARRVLGAAKVECGIGFGINMSTLPSNNGSLAIEFRDAANALNVAFYIQSTGALVAYRGNSSTGTLLGTSTVLLTAAAWAHLELWCRFDNAAGWIEARLNGVTILSVTGIDTVNTANAECSQVAWRRGGATVGIWTIDDIFAADNTGTYNNSFIGDKKVFTLMPTADTAEADWTKSTGSVGWSLIDDIPANTTDYIASTTIGDRSDFEVADLPAGVALISAVAVFGKALKTDAGTCSIRLNAISQGDQDLGASIPLTTAYTYYHEIVETDPDTGAPWSVARVNSAQIGFERTA